MRLLNFIAQSTHRPDPQPGAYDIVGDVHGQADALFHLLQTAGWIIEPHDPVSFQPISAHHPEGRHLVFVGDLVDKGPDSISVLRLLLGMTAMGTASAVRGNHEEDLLAALKKPKAARKRCVARTCSELLAAPSAFRIRVTEALRALPVQISLPMQPGAPLSGTGKLHIVHAGALPKDIGALKKGTARRLVHGEGLVHIGRKHWARAFDSFGDWIVHGHRPAEAPRVGTRVIGLDTGAGQGLRLTMLRADTASFQAIDVSLAPRRSVQARPEIFRRASV